MKVRAANEASRPTESVEKALRLLALFRAPDVPVRLAAASAATGAPRSTTHRLLATLRTLDFVRQDPATRGYFAGSALLALARSLSRDAEVREAASSELEALAKRTGETANFIVLREGKAKFIEGVEGSGVLRVAVRIGAFSPLHATAAGKALLSTLDPEAVAQLYPDERLPRITASTITSRRRLLRELAVIRQTGFATSSGESNRGVFAVAAPLRTTGGDVLGAVSLAAPLARVSQAVRAALTAEVRRAADRLAGRFS